MVDEIEFFYGSVIQHGKVNDRVYLIELGETPPLKVIRRIHDLILSNAYTKVFAKVPGSKKDQFVINGFDTEALIEGGYRGQESLCFMAKYFSTDRRMISQGDKDLIYAILGESITKHYPKVNLPEGYSYRIASIDDADELAELYGDIFDTYPFPINDPEYVRVVMGKDTIYHVIEYGGTIVASSSEEIYMESLSVELTDFATSPEHRGRGLALSLLRRMEELARGKGIKTAYTIARAKEPGVNRIFGGSDYKYSGLLRNNTNISGGLESMNVWSKPV